MPDPKKVFVVHGRDKAVRRSMFAFLRALDLEPLEWSQAVGSTGKGAPYIGEVLDAAFASAQAVLVLLTPEDEVKLTSDLCSAEDPADEREFRLQARPNVLFEAGMAFGRNPDRTVLVEVGPVKRFSDVAWRHTIRITNDARKRHEVVNRLVTAGCAVETSGTDWLSEGDFSVKRPSAPVSLPNLQASAADPQHARRSGVAEGAAMNTEVDVYMTGDRIYIDNVGDVPVYNVQLEFHLRERQKRSPLVQGDVDEKLPVRELGPHDRCPLVAALSSDCAPPFDVTVSWSRDPETSAERTEKNKTLYRD